MDLRCLWRVVRFEYVAETEIQASLSFSSIEEWIGKPCKYQEIKIDRKQFAEVNKSNLFTLYELKTRETILPIPRR